MTNIDNKKKLFDALSEDYDMGTFEVFANDVNDDVKRRKLYDAISNEYDLGDFETFSAQLLGITPAPQNTFTSEQLGLQEESNDGMITTERQVLTPTPMLGTLSVGENRREAVKDLGSASSGQGGISEYIEMLSGVKSEGQEKAEEQMRIAKERAARGERNWHPYGDTKKPLIESPDIRIGAADNVGLSTFGTQSFNADIYADEAVRRAEEGLKPADGWTEATKRAQANIANKNRQAQIRKAAEDAVGEMMSKTKNRLNTALERAGAEFDSDYRTKVGDVLEGFALSGYPMGASVTRRDTYINADDEVRTLTAARNLLNQTEKMVGDYLSRSDWGIYNIGRSAAKAVFDPATWDMGFADVNVADKLLSVVEKADKDEALSESEQLLLDAAINQQVMQWYYGELTAGQKAGKMFGESLPFMAQIAVNPLSGIGKYAASKATQAVSKYAIKKLGQKGLGKILTKVVKNMPRTAAVVTRGIGDLAGSYGVALTTNLGNTTADALNRQIGDIQYDYDNNGIARYDGRINVKDAGEAWLDAANNQAFEFYSEQMGNYFAPILKGMGKLGGKALKNFGMDGVNRWVSDFAKKGSVRQLNQFFEKTQFHGFASEYAEEIANGMLNAAFVGDMTMEDVFSKDNLIDTAIGLSVMGAIGPMVGTAGYARAKYKEKQALNEADEEGRRLMGHAWDSFADAVRRSKNGEELSANLRETLNSFGRKALPGEDMRQIISYAQAYNRYKAVEEVSAAAVAEGVMDERDLELQRQYEKGQTTTDKHGLRVTFEAAADAVEGIIPLNIGENTAYDIADEYDEQGDADTATAIRVFLSARAAHSGMTAQIREQAQSELESANAEIDSHTNKTDGNIYSVTLGGGLNGYVTGGTVITDSDGDIDIDATREANESGYVYVNVDGVIESTSVDKFVSLDGVVSAADAKAAREAEINAALNAEYEALTAPQEAAPASTEVTPESAAPAETAAAPVNNAPTVSEVAENAARALGVLPEELEEVILDEQEGLERAARYNNIGNTDSANAIRAYVAERFGTPAVQPAQVNNATAAEVGNNGGENILENGNNGAENIPALEGVAPIPVEKRGKEERQAFHLVPVERTTEELYNSGLDQQEIDAFVQANIDEINSDIEKHSKKQPKMGANIAAYKAAKEEWQAQNEDLAARLNYYKTLQGHIKGITTSNTAEAINAPIADVSDITTPEEFIAAQLGGIKITPESFRKETGLSATEQKALVGVIAGKDKGGVSIERAAEIITDNYSEELAGLGFKGDMMDVRNAIIDILSGGNPKTYAKRAAEARQMQVVDERRDQMDYIARQLGFDSVDEMIAHEETILPRIIEQYAGFDEQTYYTILVNDYNNDYDTTRESETVGRGGEVLQDEQPTNASGTKPVGTGQQGGAAASSVQSNGANVATPENQEVVGNSEQLNQSGDNTEMGAYLTNEVSKEAPTDEVGPSVKTTEGQSASAERRNLADFKEDDVVRDYYDKKLYRIKKHSKNGVSTIAMLDKEGNEVGTTQMNAHNNSRYSLAEAPVKAESPTMSQESEQVGEQVEKKAKAKKGVEKIEDVGEKIGGAKKDKLRETIDRMKTDIQQSDETLIDKIANLPISKIFNFDFQKLREGGMPNDAISFMEIVRKSIPAKPRTSHKVRRWVNNTLALYKLCLEVGTNWDKVNTVLSSRDFAGTDLKAQYDAYMSVGGFDSGLNIGNAKLKQLDKTAGYYKDGKFISSEGKWYVRDAGKHSGIYDTKEDAVEALKAFAGDNAGTTESGKKKEVKFAVYQRREDKSIFIAIKGKSDIVIQDGFKSAKEAFDYIGANNAELQSRYRNLLDKTNADFEENRERKGRDYRNGKDVSDEEFRSTFGFRGVEFGNWMAQEDRKKAINECYDALMDLAEVCKVSPRALSLDGTLAMAFGARGGGKFSAHYEPGKVVINMTKTRGAGSLAHEWFHALDNYFAKMGKDDIGIYATAGEGMLPEGFQKIGDKFYDKNSHRMLTAEEAQAKIDAHKVRAEMASAWNYLMNKLKKSDYYKRSNAYARLHNSKYWNNPTELGARAFSIWVENELSKQDISNDYLANNPRYIKSEVTDAQDKYMPYPFDTDADWMDEAFGNLFEVMQEKVTEKSNIALYQRGSLSLDGENPAFRAATEKTMQALQKTGVEVVMATEEQVNALMGADFSRAAAPFYSNARKAVLDIKQEKATPEQWVAMLKKNGGLKAGEDAWVGLEDWLNNQQRTVTKQEILDYLTENSIQIEEVEYAEDASSHFYENPQDQDFSWTDKMVDKVEEMYGVSEGIEYMPFEHLEFTGSTEERLETAKTVNENAEFVDADYYDLNDEDDIKEFISQIEIALMHDIDRWSFAESEEGVINSTRLEYTTDGLENKREIALVVPTIEPYNASDEVHFGDAGNGRAVAWVRFGETTDSEGNRVLVIDEIQSKRHQDGREKGYGRATSEDVKSALEAVNAAQSEFDEYNAEMAKKYGSEYDWNIDATDAEIDKWQELYDKVAQLGQVYEDVAESNRKGIPSAPFEKNWHELAMKRMLRLAAEEGFDKVAWTTGEQQARRYDIGAVVNRIESTDTIDYDSKLGVDLVKQVVLFTRDGNAITLRLTPEGIVRASSQYNGHHISDIVGKELGNRIMTETDLVLKEQDLRIGGEGMKGFYDKMLSSFVQKYTKKWGAKVGEVTMPGLKENNTMHSVDVTPEMRESVMQGQPMFLRTSDGTVYGWAVNGKIYLTPDGINPNTPVHEYTHLWASAIEQNDPKLWRKIVEAMKQSPVWNEVMADEAYRDIWNDDNRVASEVLSRLSGNENYRRTMQEAAERENDPTKKFGLIAAWGRVKRALADFWNAIKGLFGADNATPWEQFVNSAIGDFYKGVNPNVQNSSMERMTMGSRVDARMAEVAARFDGKQLTTEQRAVVDVFGGKSDNLTISVKTKDGKDRKIEMRQGNDLAGARHSLYVHYGTTKGVISADDIVLIPDVLANGERTVNGKKAVYKLDINGTKYTVVTYVKQNKEEFHNFYSNKKGQPSQSVNAEIGDTQSARITEELASADKGSDNSLNSQENDDILFRSVGGNSGYDFRPKRGESTEQRENRMNNYTNEIITILKERGFDVTNSRSRTSFGMSNYVNVYSPEGRFLEKIRISDHSVLRNSRVLDEYNPLPTQSPADVVADLFGNNTGDMYREGEGTYTDEEINFANDPVSKVLGKPRGTKKKQREFAARQRQRMAERVESLAKKLHLDNVEIITDASALEDKKQRAKGFYTKSTGKITIVIPNHSSTFDVEQTLLHEAVAHYGLRQLFGEHFDTFLDNVFKNADASIRKRILELAQKKNWDLRTATEEYLASLAEETNFENTSASWWRQIKELFLNMLHKIGYEDFGGVTLTDNELRYILWRSYENLAEPGKFRSILGEVSDIAKQYELKVGNYAQNSTDASTAAENDDLFRDGDSYSDAVSNEKESALSKKESALSKKEAARKKRLDDIRQFGTSIEKMLDLMRTQKEYDRTTVETLVKLANNILDMGLVSELSRYEIKRLLAPIVRGVGQKNLTRRINEIVNALLDAQLAACEHLLDKQLKTKGSKITNKGVEAQGSLDAQGQQVLTAFKEGRLLDKKSLTQRLTDALNRMGDDSSNVASVAAAEYQGLLLAQKYREDITDSVTEGRELHVEIIDARESKAAGRMSAKAFSEFKLATEEAILKNKMERVDAYLSFLGMLSGTMKGSVDRAKEFRKEEVERVREIQHNANSDMEGRTAAHTSNPKMEWFYNNPIVRFFMNPLATFDYMLRRFGDKSVKGEGYLWNRFMGGYIKANDEAWKGLYSSLQELDAKVSEVFGKKMKWADLFYKARYMPKALVTMWNGEKMEEFTITQGNMLYIYMVNKMEDGQMKLRKMGITESVVDELTKKIDPRLKDIADWVQDTFLKNKRNKYNEVYERMFGAPMAAIENYFPLVINSRSRGQEVDISEPDREETTPSTITGSIIKRRRNSLPLDILNADAFDVVTEHLRKMEHWAAFAEYSRDLNALLSYNRFKNQVLNMSTLRFGAGTELWRNFQKVASISAGAYTPAGGKSSFDKAAVNISKGVTAAKISFRIFTAFKQLLSAPAYLASADWRELVKSFFSMKESWNWAIKELPGFAERWQSRMAGNEKLKSSDVDWDVWKNKYLQNLQKYGMATNAAIDAATVAFGANAIYNTALKRYKDAGFSEEEAKKKALNEASVLFNETQQSSEGAYMSPMQMDRTLAANALTIYRNASMGYQRKLMQSVYELKRMAAKGYKKESVEFMAKQYEREGLTKEQARIFAEEEYKNSLVRNLANVAVFGFILQFAWNLGAYLPYLIFGDDDDKKADMKEDAAVLALCGGWVEGLSGGNIISGALFSATEGDLSKFTTTTLPIISELEQIVKSKDPVKALEMAVNLLVQSGIGTNPQTLSDAIVGIIDFAKAEDKNFEEATILFLRTINAPQSSINQLLLDRVEDVGTEIKEGARFAEYQMQRNYPFTNRFQTDEGYQERRGKYLKRFDELYKERVGIGTENIEDVNALIDAENSTREKDLLFKEQKKVLEKDKPNKEDFKQLDAVEQMTEMLNLGNINYENYIKQSTAADGEDDYQVKTIESKLKKKYDKFKELEGDAKLEYYNQNKKDLDLYLDSIRPRINSISKCKKNMELNPDNAEEWMQTIRETRQEIINIYGNE